MSLALDRGGMSAMFSDGAGTLEEVMACCDCRMRVEQASDALENGPGGDRRRAGDRSAKERKSVV